MIGDARLTSQAGSGFTLIEILLAISIAALTLAVALPSISRPGGALSGEASEAASLVRRARLSALREKRTFDLGLSNGALAFWPKGEAAFTSAVPGAAAEASPEVISFFPDGTSSGGSVRVTGDAPFTVSADRAGRIAFGSGR